MAVWKEKGSRVEREEATAFELKSATLSSPELRDRKLRVPSVTSSGLEAGIYFLILGATIHKYSMWGTGKMWACLSKTIYFIF